jgi:hypothetical protein
MIVGMLNIQTRPQLAIRSSSRVATGRRVKAARMMAGGISIRAAATASGLSYAHLLAVEHGTEPLTASDATDLGTLLSVPADWLVAGWS